MVLYLLEPEVSGGRGKNTVYENLEAVLEKREHPIIKHLHYEFSGWLGDDIIEGTPCFIVTEKLARKIISSDLKGYKITDVEISVNEQFRELYPNKKLPSFRRLIPLGNIEIVDGKFRNWTEEDFCLSKKNDLVVTKKALDVLMKFNLNHCDITTLEALPTRPPLEES